MLNPCSLRKTVRSLVVFFVATSFLSCQSASSVYADCGDIQILERGFCSVSFVELLGNPDAISGQDISVYGYVAVEDGIAYLLPTIEDIRKENDEVAVVLDVSRRFAAQYSGEPGYAEIRGKFIWYPEKRNPNRRQIVSVHEE